MTNNRVDPRVSKWEQFWVSFWWTSNYLLFSQKKVCSSNRSNCEHGRDSALYNFRLYLHRSDEQHWSWTGGICHSCVSLEREINSSDKTKKRTKSRLTSTAASIAAASVPSAALVSFPQAWRILKLPQGQLSCFGIRFWKFFFFSGVDAFGFDGYRSSLHRRFSTLGYWLVCVSKPQHFQQWQLKLKVFDRGN